ncbi:DUF1799 domain-containing protein [Acidovorax sp. BLS4]|uniref:DUF1799 domain-containing protein n=1 Tax=Acidovorax sp. BLS4 TaxID=3273430 RepID=UPI0029421F5B|nr:DUF1799 domain-containing protein [Paracidovorax avenae]WOI46968.1 DUF1799 domain-containing protein [Paracidovorax avenae]
MDPEQARQANAEAGVAPESDEVVELSPREWRAWEVFGAVRTNWRIVATWGAVHYEGIDYGSLQAAMQMLGTPQKRRSEVFWMVRVMEDEARKWLNKR